MVQFDQGREGGTPLLIVSPPGIHISLGICVRGYTYHGDTHITVTPVCDMVFKFWWFLGVADHQMTSLLACYQPLQILIWANECKIFVGLSVPTNSLTTFDLHN